MSANLKPMTFEEWLAANPDVLAEQPKPCETCNGTGSVECRDCTGTGLCTCLHCDAEHDCGGCNGDGLVECDDCGGEKIEDAPKLAYEAQLYDDKKRLEHYQQVMAEASK